MDNVSMPTTAGAANTTDSQPSPSQLMVKDYTLGNEIILDAKAIDGSNIILRARIMNFKDASCAKFHCWVVCSDPIAGWV